MAPTQIHKRPSFQTANSHFSVYNRYEAVTLGRTSQSRHAKSLTLSNKVKPSYDTLQRLYSTLKLTPVELALIMKNGDIKGRNKLVSEYGKQDKVESSKE